MSISPTKPFSAASESGYSLMEMIVAVGLGGIVTMFVGAFLVGAKKIQKTVEFRADLENYRTELSGQIDCSKKCAGLKEGKSARGNLVLNVSCHSLFNDAEVTLEKPTGEVIANVYTLEQSVCRTRRPKQCLYACHNQDIMLERGYLFPGIDRTPRSSDFRCPSGNLIGVDFSTKRIICASKIELPPGPMCKQDVVLNVKKTDTHRVSIAGPIPCAEHTMDQVRWATLAGPVKVELASEYTPESSDKFVIVHASSIHGRFSNQDDIVVTSKGTFKILYEPKKITLTGFRRHKIQSTDTPAH